MLPKVKSIKSFCFVCLLSVYYTQCCLYPVLIDLSLYYTQCCLYPVLIDLSVYYTQCCLYPVLRLDTDNIECNIQKGQSRLDTDNIECNIQKEDKQNKSSNTDIVYYIQCCLYPVLIVLSVFSDVYSNTANQINSISLC
jgi:hypothetical protein